MDMYVYVKYTEDINSFHEVIDILRDGSSDVYFSTENRRSHRELEEFMRRMKPDDVIVIGSLSSLGLNETEVANRLSWFISQSRLLAVCDYAATYEYGVSQPLNRAVLETLLQSLLSSHANITKMPRNRKANSGRKKISFPDNWDELYEKWDHKEITSKAFIEMTGLKKATFYNLLTEYKERQDRLQAFVSKYA